jgi:hypothetical protein
MKIDRGLLIAALLPGALILGAWPAALATLVVASGLIRPLGLFDTDERRQLADAYRAAAAKFRDKLPARQPAGARTH